MHVFTVARIAIVVGHFHIVAKMDPIAAPTVRQRTIWTKSNVATHGVKGMGVVIQFLVQICCFFGFSLGFC